MLKNKKFLTIALFLLVKEIFLAGSTFFMAMAGQALATQEFEDLKEFIAFFFVFALLAYFFSSCATYVCAKLRVQLWHEYVLNTFRTIKFDQAISSKKNRDLTIGWLTGEAPAAFERISEFYVGFLSVYFNVTFTLIVFGFTLGPQMVIAMTISIFASLLVVGVFRKFIAKSGKDIQNTKLQAVVSINRLWGTFINTNDYLANQALDQFSANIRAYFNKSTRYSLAEQAMACTPIYLCVPVIVFMMLTSTANDAASMGVLVAVLPRSLQLLGNVHSMSLLNSNFLFVKSQYENLEKFTENLERHTLREHIDLQEISVWFQTDELRIRPDIFIDKIQQRQIANGRYLISGGNGTGKSTLLKLIKSIEPSSILVAPDVDIVGSDEHSSTGKNQIKQIDLALSQESKIYLLDEWDANLDVENFAHINSVLDATALTSAVIEVRH